MRVRHMKTVAGHVVRIVSSPSSGMLRADDGRYYERAAGWLNRVQSYERPHRR